MGARKKEGADLSETKPLEFKILETAIRLFNEEGYVNVSIRDIANTLKISPGNLTYYYKKKNDLIKAIFDLQYREYRDMKLSACNDLEGLNAILKKMMQHQKKYAFYFHNIVEIPRLYPELSHLQMKIFTEFRDLFKASLLNLDKRGIVRPEVSRDRYDDLGFALLSLALFWNQQEGVHKRFTKKDIVQLQWSILLPIFSQEGLEEYHALS